MAAEMDINSALKQLEAVEANLEKAEQILDEISKLSSDTRSGLVFDDRVRALSQVISVLPGIDGWKPSGDVLLLEQDSSRIRDLKLEIKEYRHRLSRQRRKIVREPLQRLMAKVDLSLEQLRKEDNDGREVNETVTGEDWEKLKKQIQAIAVLLGGDLSRPPRWGYLERHIGFGMVQDLRDIIEMDWPAVKSGLSKMLYHDDEPLPVAIKDFAELSESEASGEVVTELKWSSLSDEKFERLIFSLFSNARAYENPQWLSNTRASDKGRDLSVTHVVSDPLLGVKRRRVIVQCKHWLTKAIGMDEISKVKEQMRLWEPPRVDVLIFATSGRFSTDAVVYIEKHNAADSALQIEMWPNSHLELLLARRPGFVAEFGLR